MPSKKIIEFDGVPSIVGYARVSSREQALNSNALDQQIDRLRSAGCQVVYYDVESAYKGKHYPGLSEVLGLVRAKAIDKVICTRLDRLSRRGIRSFQIFEEFIQSGVVLKVLDEDVDLSSAAGRMAAGILAVMAQHHSDEKAAAISHGWEYLRKRGASVCPPFGYKKEGDRFVLSSDPFLCLLSDRREYSKAEIARSIVDVFLDRGTARKTVRWMNEHFGIMVGTPNSQREQKGGIVARNLFRFSPSGLINWLTSEVLIGHTRYFPNRKEKVRIVPDTHEPLISEEEHYLIKEMLQTNREKRGFGATNLKHPLSGLVYCGECQSAAYTATGSQNYQRAKRLGIPVVKKTYFQCKNWRVRACPQQKMVPYESVNAAAVRALLDRATEIANLAGAKPSTKRESQKLKKMRQELADLEALSTARPRLIGIIEELRAEIKALASIEAGENAIDASRTKILIEQFSDPAFWEAIPDSSKKVIFRQLVQRIEIRDGLVSLVSLKV